VLPSEHGFRQEIVEEALFQEESNHSAPAARGFGFRFS